MLNTARKTTELVANKPRKTDENHTPPFSMDDGRRKRCSYAAYNEAEQTIWFARQAKCKLVNVVNHCSGIDLEDFRNIAQAIVHLTDALDHGEETCRAMKSYEASNG